MLESLTILSIFVVQWKEIYSSGLFGEARVSPTLSRSLNLNFQICNLQSESVFTKFFSWLLNKFCLKVSWEVYREKYGEYTY